MEKVEITQEKQWDASLYDDKHSFVWKYGEEVIELLAPRAGERILDLGCGTGHLTNKIAAVGASVVGIDISSDMIEQARALYPALRFELGDAARFQFEEPFDGVFSNAALHWVEEQDRVTECILKALKPGGRFVAEFGGKRNTQAIKEALYEAVGNAGLSITEEVKFRFFPSIGEYATLLESHGLTVTYARYFERPTPLEGGEKGMRSWLEMFANNVLDSVPEEKRAEVIHLAEESLRSELYREGQWFADYRRIRVIAIAAPAR